MHTRNQIYKTGDSTAKTASAPKPSVPELRLPSAIGNRAFGNLLVSSRWPVQRKLQIGQTNDPLERDADRVAAEVDGPPGRAVSAGMVVSSPASISGYPAGAAFDARLNSQAGRGDPLPAQTRASMEARIGADFSAVRIHTGPEPAQLSRDIGARAFTHGPDIYFGEGRHDFGSRAGKQLLAHELTHTIQQGAASILAPAGPRGRLPGTVQRGGEDGVTTVPTLDDLYRAALQKARQTGNWQDAAEKLNGFSHEDIQSRLAQLSDTEVAYINAGAVENPRVGPDSQVAQLTKPGTPRASTVAPPATQGPRARVAPPKTAQTAAPAAATNSIAAMSAVDKLLEAFHRAKINQAFRDKVLSLITPKALCIAILSFAAAFVISQFTPVGWAADLGLALTALFIGTAVFSALNHLVKFADARNATSLEELDQAGREFADAVAELEVDAIILLVTHGVSGGLKGGGVAYKGPPPSELVLATGRGGLVVPVAASTISAAEAARLGIKAAGASTAMMTQGSGSGGSSGPKSTQAPQTASTPVQTPATPPKGIAAKGVEIVDARRSPLGEFDEIASDRFIEDKSAKGLGKFNPKTGQSQSAAEWAKKQIFDKTVVRIENLKNATATRPTKLSGPTVPTLAEIKSIRQLEFRVEAGTPEIRAAVETQIQALAGKYPDWSFGATYGL